MTTTTLSIGGIVLLFIGCHLTAAGDPCVSKVVETDTGSYNVTLVKNTVCKWEFNISADKEVYLVVDELILAPGDIARFSKTSSPKVLELSGLKRNVVVVLSAQNSTLTLDSTKRNLETPAAIKFSYNASECKMSVKGNIAEISAPHFWSPVKSPVVTCKYQISGTSGLKNQIWSFKQVDLKKGDVVFKVDNTTVDKFSDDTTHSNDFLIDGNETTIEITMATSKEQLGFEATYKFFEKEPSVIDLNETKTIANPGFPYGYLGSQDLRWLIKAPDSGYFVKVEVNDLDLADASDQLLIVDDDSLYGRPLGQFMGGSAIAKGTVLLSSKPKLWVQFKTNARQETSRGFSVTLTPETFSRSVVVVDEPVYFHMETDNTTTIPESENITYQLTVPVGERVQVTFNDSVLLPLSTVTFYEGWTSSYTPLAMFSTSTPFYTVVSSSNKMLMVVEGFGTNGTKIQRLGGIVTKATSSKSDVYEILTAKQGALQFNAINGSVKAGWVLPNYDDELEVSLYIKELKVPTDVWLLVYDGLSDLDTCIATLGQDSVEGNNFPIIRAKNMRVEILDERNSTLEDPVQFEATYGTESACKQTLESGIESGQIMTPGFPNQYPYNELCEWKLNTGKDNIVHLYFDAFQVYSEHNFNIDISTTQNETYDNHSIIITNTSTIFSGSGDVIPDDLIVTDISDMSLTFDSEFNDKLDDLHVGQGVKVNFEYLACGGNVTQANSSLASPGFPSNISETTRCVWIVTLPPPADNTSVSILKFKLYAGIQGKDDPSINSLMIRDGGSMRAPPVSGNLTEGQEVMSRTNVIWVEYVFQPATKKSTGFPFQLNYTTYECPLSQQCKNSICLHPDWKCDGYDQCGDHTDEDGCTCVTTKTGAVSYLALGMSILATFVIAVLIACIAPVVYKKVRFGGYTELRDFMTPVPT